MKSPLIVSLAVGFLLTCVCSAAEKFQPLFNGKDLTGWHVVNGQAPYTVEDGIIVGTTVVGSPNSFLATVQEYGDFVLEFDVKMDAGKTFNSGVQFRSLSKSDVQSGRVHGYQCEIDPSERGFSGGIYDEARRGWLYPVSLNPPALRLFREGEWNHYRIEAIGPNLRTWVNGKPVAHLIDDMTSRGFIALQVHAIKDASEAGRKVYFRDVRIATENLQPTPATPGQHIEDRRASNSKPTP